MKNINIKSKLFGGLLITLVMFTACTDDLNRFPTNGITNEVQYETVEGYKQSLVTIYSTLSLNDFLRNYWNMQELTTDEAVSTWDDDGILSYHIFNWTADNVSIERVYSSALYNVTLCNNFIIESSDESLASRGFTGADLETIGQFKAEARFLRAYFYWILMDLYGNPPFATEESLLAGVAPQQIMRPELFKFIVDELTEIEPILANVGANEYGRAVKAANWALLSRLYLNAEVYIKSPKYTEALTYSKKVIEAGYTLVSDYNWLMLGDNHLNADEFIFTANYSNEFSVTWGGTNYIALGAAGVTEEVNGMSSSWGSLRMTQQIPALFPTHDQSVDKRGQFWTNGQNLEIEDLGTSIDGYSSYKYRNLDRDGNAIKQNNTYNNICDIDFPIFRTAEIYLNYAEAVLRGGTGGDAATALGYINKIRGRAYGSNPESNLGNISSAELTLDFILDERAREMYWEGIRRTDLIRYNKLTSNEYVWAWKGGVKSGKGVDEKYNLFPLPTTDVLANKNLDQNPDY